MAVLTRAAAKSYLNIAGTNYDAELDDFIAAAVSIIEQRVGPLEPTVVTSRVTAGSSLVLPVYPVLSLTSLTDSGSAAVDLDLLHLDTAAGIVTGLSSGYYFGSHAYTVTYTAGRNPVPADLVLAVKELVRHLWMTQRGPTGRPGSAQSDAVSNTVPGAAYIFPFRVEQLLAPHTPVAIA